MFPISLPENVRVYTRCDHTSDVERKIPELARLRQADYDEGASWTHKIGHSREACLRVHVMKRGHRHDQIKACWLKLMLEKVTKKDQKEVVEIVVPAIRRHLFLTDAALAA